MGLARGVDFEGGGSESDSSEVVISSVEVVSSLLSSSLELGAADFLAGGFLPLEPGLEDDISTRRVEPVQMP